VIVEPVDGLVVKDDEGTELLAQQEITKMMMK
jgi:hypothetical protein